MGRRRGGQPPGERRAERIIAIPTSRSGKPREEASLGRPAPWVPRDLPSWADETERPHRRSGSPGWGGGDAGCLCLGFLWATLAQPEGPPSLQQQAGSPLSEQPSYRKSKARERPLGFRKQKQKPWNGQGQTGADKPPHSLPGTPSQNCSIAGCLLSCHLVSRVILGALCCQAQSSPHKEPSSCPLTHCCCSPTPP